MPTKNLDQLELSVIRPHESVDLNGRRVAIDTPRHTEITNIGSSSAWTVLEDTVDHQREYFGAGYDHDGSPLSIQLNRQDASKLLYFFRDNDHSSPVLTKSLLRTLGGPTNKDILAGTTLEDATYAYEPVAAVIIQGLILFACTKVSVANGIESMAMVTMQASDASSTDWFSVGQINAPVSLPDLGGNTNEYGTARGKEWCVCNYVPDSDSETLSGAWVTIVDYCSNPGSVGGQVGVVYVQRPAVGDQWTVGALKLCYDTIVTLGTQAGKHMHGAWVHQPTPSHIVLGTAEGDGEDNVNTLIVLKDTVGGDIRTNYNTITPTLYHDRHGDADVTIPKISNQWVASCPAPKFGEILVTGDEDNAVLFKIVCPDPDNIPTKIEITPVWGVATGDSQSSVKNANFDSLWIQCPAPELKEHYVIRLNPSPTNVVSHADGSRILYSPDGEHWEIAGKYPIGATSPDLVYTTGGKIVIVNFTNGTNVYARDVPTLNPVRGIEVRSGYTSLTRTLSGSDTLYEQSGADASNTVGVLAPTASGEFLHPSTGSYISPPPTMSPVYRLQCAGTFNSFGSFKVTDVNSCVNTKPVFVQVYIYPLSDGAELRTLGYGAGAGSQCDTGTRSSGWHPVTLFSDTSGEASTFEIRFFTYSGPIPVNCDFLLSIGEVSQSGRCAGVPQRTVQEASGTTVSSVGEQCEVTGFVLGASWSISLRLKVPRECWDTSLGSFLGTGIEPLLTLRLDDTSYIYAYADITNDKIVVEVTSGGTTSSDEFTGLYFGRKDDIRIAFSNNGGTSVALEMAGGRGGEVTATKVIPKTLTPTSIRFSDKDWATIAQIDVFDVFVDDSVAYTPSELADWLSSDMGSYCLESGSNNFHNGNYGTFS